jgi:hypothetical protein
MGLSMSEWSMSTGIEGRVEASIEWMASEWLNYRALIGTFLRDIIGCFEAEPTT